MIDTVRCKCAVPWRGGVRTPPGWEIQERPPARYDKGGTVKWATDQRLVIDGATGLRIGGSGGAAEWMEASLPRVLFGHNGRMIETQGQIGESLERLGELVAYWCDGSRADFFREFTRVDLVFQFRGSPAAWCAAFVESSHPCVRRKAREFFGRGVTWEGKETVIRLYDKILEASDNKVQDGDVVRFEVELKGAALRKRLATEISRETRVSWVRSLDFARCYREYRRVMLGFQPRSLARPPSGYNRLVAFLHHHRVVVDSVPILGLVRPTVSRATWFRIKQAIREFRPEFTRIDLAALLPERFEPASVVHVDAGADPAAVAGVTAAVA